MPDICPADLSARDMAAVAPRAAVNPPLKGNNEGGCGHYREAASFNTAGEMNFILRRLGGNDLFPNR